MIQSRQGENGGGQERERTVALDAVGDVDGRGRRHPRVQREDARVIPALDFALRIRQGVGVLRDREGGRRGAAWIEG